MPSPGFYNRTTELADVQAICGEPRSTLAIVYGARGAGKTRLFEEALAGQKHYYYQATKRVMVLQLEDMTKALRAVDPSLITRAPVHSVEALFEILADLADRDPSTPLSVVIDELPYLADADAGLLTAIQKWWRTERRKRGNLKLFFLGSRQSWMRREAVSDDAALKTSRTHNLEVKSLSYRHTASFYSTWSPVDRVRAWAVWGGLPSALEELDPTGTLWGNIELTTLHPRARLYAEPEWLKYTELRSDALYSSLVRAIAQGARSAGDIAVKVGKNSATDVFPYLNQLREARIVDRRPARAANGEMERTALYVLADPFLAYWYRFVDPNRSALERGQRAETLAMLHDHDEGLDKLVSEQAFEDVGREFVADAHASGRFPPDFKFDALGSWWRGSRTEAPEQLDVVAYHRRALTAVGECKWTEDPVGMGEVEDLRRIVRAAAKDLKPHPRHYRMLFSKSGFTEDVRRLADEPSQRLLLFEPQDLYW